MVVGTLQLALYVRGSRSLKEKRHVVHKIRDRLKAKFNVSVAEVANNDDWKRIRLGVAFVSNEQPFAQKVLDEVLAFVRSFPEAELLGREIDFVRYKDKEFVGIDLKY